MAISFSESATPGASLGRRTVARRISDDRILARDLSGRSSAPLERRALHSNSLLVALVVMVAIVLFAVIAVTATFIRRRVPRGQYSLLGRRFYRHHNRNLSSSSTEPLSPDRWANPSNVTSPRPLGLSLSDVALKGPSEMSPPLPRSADLLRRPPGSPSYSSFFNRESTVPSRSNSSGTTSTRPPPTRTATDPTSYSSSDRAPPPSLVRSETQPAGSSRLRTLARIRVSRFGFHGHSHPEALANGPRTPGFRIEDTPSTPGGKHWSAFVGMGRGRRPTGPRQKQNSVLHITARSIDSNASSLGDDDRDILPLVPKPAAARRVDFPVDPPDYTSSVYVHADDDLPSMTTSTDQSQSHGTLESAVPSSEMMDPILDIFQYSSPTERRMLFPPAVLAAGYQPVPDKRSGGR